MVEAAILTCRWLGLRPTHPSQRYGVCLRRFFMVNLPHGREIQGSLGVRSLLLRSILRLVRLNGLSVNGNRITDGVLDFNGVKDDNTNKLVGGNLRYAFGGTLEGLTLGVHGLSQQVDSNDNSSFTSTKTNVTASCLY